MNQRASTWGGRGKEKVKNHWARRFSDTLREP